MRKIHLLLAFVFVYTNLWPQAVRRPIAASYVGLGAYSINHVDAFSFTANQAALAQIKATSFGVYGEKRFLLNNTNMYSAVLAVPSKQGNFGVQVDYFGFKNYNESQLGIAYARSLGKALDIGVKFNYYSFRIPAYQTSSTVDFEIGAIAHLTDKFNVGIHFYNPVGGNLSKTGNEKLGSIYKFGFGYEASENLLVSAEIVKQENLPVNVNAGIQYNFQKQFFARVGVESENESPYVGAGVSWKNVRLDVSASYHPQLGFTPGLMVIVNANSKKLKLTNKIIPVIILCIIAFTCKTHAQVKPAETTEPPPVIQQQLENLTEASDDAETEDDSYLQELVHFIKEPINLNYADEGELQELKLLTPVQISNLIAYRHLLGKFLNIYELQAVPDWNLALIRRIRPYITVITKVDVFKNLGSRLKNGTNTILVRATQVLEKSRGYILNASNATSFYPGSPQKVFVRYKYMYKNLLQYGILGEKDAGEQFFKGAQSNGFDFYSAHFFVRNLGIIKALAIGDFTVSMGQGLTQWGGLAFKKGSDVINIKRQSDILRPYNSAGEIAFNRGVGITLQKRKWEATGFASYRKLDANFNVDTLNFQDFVSSLQTSGYHRTAGEVADKGTQGQLTLGGNINYSSERFHIGVNAVHYNFEHNITKAVYPYNAYALSGKTAGNYSADYSYTYKNMHFFGEASTDENLDKAFINGLLISMDQHVDMSFLYRKISRGYKSLYTNAFTESTYPTNESGFYTGISISPVDYIRLDAYADFYNFPWIKYRVDAPTAGHDYLVQLSYRPNKQVNVYLRYKTERKAINYNPDALTLNPVVVQPKQALRSQFTYKVNTTFTISSRVELSWYDKNGPAAENGFLIFTDLMYKPLRKPYSGNVRLQYFETDGYNSRLYAYENDVLYAYSIPVFYDKGYRYYFNIDYDVTKKLSFEVRFAQTVYPDKKIISSGLDEIQRHTRSEVTIQAIYTF